jgi:hypothetical protein
MCTDAPRFTSRWIIGRLPAAQAAALRVVAEEVEAAQAQVVAVPVVLLRLLADVVLARLRVSLLPLFRMQVRPLRVVAVEQVPRAVVDEAEQEVAAAVEQVEQVEQVAVREMVRRPLVLFARVLPFPAWRSSMPCLQPASIPMQR